MEKWNAVKTPPASALKKIVGGRLKGMTDIKPQWRYQVMTETYGLCGIGWKYELVDRWLEDGSEGQKVAFAEINLFVKIDGEWSDAIPGTGGSMLVAKESSGLHTNDECYKMAMTDALSVTMAKIGVASDIYMGLWDGSKYRDKPPEKREDVPQAPEDDIPDFITPSQLAIVDGYLLKLDITRKGLAGWLVSKKKLSEPDVTKLTQDDATAMVRKWDDISADIKMYSLNMEGREKANA